MDRSKLRISKACQECRARKIRCDGGEPCQRCQFRDVECVYRKKARIRMKKSDRLGLAGSSSLGGEALGEDTGGGLAAASVSSSPAGQYTQHASSHQSTPQQRASQSQWPRDPEQNRRPPHLGDTPISIPGIRSGLHNLHNPSVAATHRASPSVFLQLYYGPSSNFSLLNSIYHQIEGTQPGQRRRRGKSNAGGSRKDGVNKNSGANGADGLNTGDVKQDVASSRGSDDGSDDYGEDDDDGEQDEHDGGHENCTPRGVEEIGPGLDLFNNRRLYFGDLAGGSETSFAIGGNGSFTDGASMFIDRALAERLLERYLNTFWLLLPIWTRATFRERLSRFYEPTSLLGGGDPDTIIMLMALSLGASMLEVEMTAQYLYRMAKKWAAGLDEMVNVQTVQISLMMSHFASERARPNSSFLLAGTAVRKAVAAGLHKGVLGGGGSGNSAQAQEAARQMRITIWGLYFWETWICFSLGRPSSFPESEMDVPFPTEERLLQAVVTLARIMSKSVTCIYRSHHDSLLPLWNAANDIRRELRQFAEKQREDFNFGVVDDPNAGELGVCQTIVSTLYHHTLILTFRPFLVLRAKLRQEDGASHPPPPAWLDTACEYCLDAARHSIAFLIRACERNEMCRSIRYHAFFIEGASHVLAFDLLQDKKAQPANFPWLQLAIRALQMVLPGHINGMALPVDISSNLEQMIQSVYPDFKASGVDTNQTALGLQGQNQSQSQNQNQQNIQDAQQQLNIHGLGGLGTGSASMGSPAAGFAGGTPGAMGMNGAPHGGAPGSSTSTSSLPVPQAPPPPLPPTIPVLGHQNANPLGLNNLNGMNDLNSFSDLSNALPPLLFPFTPFGGLDEAVGSTTQSPSGGGAAPFSGSTNGGGGHTAGEAPMDLTAADLGWNFDFGTMNMEAFLSIDPNMQADFNLYRT